MKLHTFYRSSAAYRVRIALNLKGVAYERLPRNLAKAEQHEASYLAINPQGFVPALDVGSAVLSQSLAMIEYLEETHPRPALLPADPIARAQVRALALTIACDIHPLNNLRVLKYLRKELAQDEDRINQWYRHWITAGFEAIETTARQCSSNQQCLFGDSVTLADVLLVPQMYNARRFDTDLAPFPTLVAIDAHLQTLPAFAEAKPERQPDAE